MFPLTRRIARSDRLLRSAAVLAVVTAGAVLPATAARADEGSTVVGELVQAYPEQAAPSHDGVAEQPLSWIRTAEGQSVRVPTEDLPDVPAGSTVSVDVGAKVSDDASADGYAPAHDVLSADVLATPAPAAAPANHQVTVALVVPAGGQQDGVTLDQVVSAVDGPVASFWSEQTGGAVRFGVTAAHDWMTTTAGCSDPNALWAEVAAKTGFVAGPGRHLVVYLSSLPGDLAGCSYALGQVGRDISSGGSLYVRDALPTVIAHELGHNLGLGHSSALQCDGTLDSGRCRTAAYRDYYDVMGASWSSVGALTAAQADRLGVLPGTARADVAPGAAPGSYVLAPLAGTAGTRAVRLTAADGSVYWLEYRTATGQDAWLGTAADRFRLGAGVLLHRAGGFPDTSLLLDGTPAPAAGWDGDLQAALPVGVPVVVDGGAFTVTVEDLAAGAATVSVVAAPAPLAAATAPTAAPAPEGAVLPGRPAVAPSTESPAATAAATPSGAAATPPTSGIGEAAAATPASDLAEAAATHDTDPRRTAGLCALAGGVVLAAGTGGLYLRRRAKVRR